MHAVILLIMTMIGLCLLSLLQIQEYWDFEDIPTWCKMKRPSNDDIPRFGGNPNPSQVWSMDGGCGCAFH